MKKGMPMREAYRKAGLKPEEMDWASMGMDIKTCAKEMNVRPRKGLLNNQPVMVGPKDLLRAMGYSEYGYPLHMQKWHPGSKDGCHPRWVQPDGADAPRCRYRIPMVAETGNEVTPFVGCEKYEDMGAVVRFTCPYVFVQAEQKWFRLTGGHPSEQLKDMTVRHFAHVLRMAYETGTINSSHGWIRKYPMEAHDLIPQLYYRGSEEHAPAFCRYYPAGRGYNDILSFDARKAEFSPDELEKRAKAERLAKEMASRLEKVRSLERLTLLKDLTGDAKLEDEDFRKSLRKAELDTETKKIEQVLLDRQKGELIRQAQSHMLERMRVDLED
mmetsp:Transcript_55168/g.89418  ORF Transcript_55168/g.89418 Transcript_55168/m.89418 type:complete len:328 (-) Transcript_55168:555-1538(-)